MADAHLRPYRTPRGQPRWELRLRVDGRERSRTFDDRRAAERWLAYAHAAGSARALLAIDQDDSTAPEVCTVQAAVEAHIAELSGITKGTRDGYAREAARDIYPHLGALPLTSLSSADVAAWINRLEKAGLAGKTIQNRHALLSAACARAVDGRLIESNPCRGARIPRAIRKPPVFLTVAQIGELLDAMHSRPHWEHQRSLIIATLGTGMRWGEITALPIRYLTRAGTTLRVEVRQAWKDTDSGAMQLGPPKSRRSERTIPLPIDSPAARAMLNASIGRSGDAFVFTGFRGGVLRGGTFHRGTWQPLLDQLGWAQRPRFHDLRHTAASLMIADGAQIDAVSRILGHEKTSTTWDVYGHLVPGARESALNTLGQRLGDALDI